VSRPTARVAVSRIVAALVLLLACNPPTPSVTCIGRCGLRLTGEMWGTCEDFTRAELRAVDAMRSHLPTACARLDGWRVVAVATDGGGWVDQWGRTVAGLTYCQARTIAVERRPWWETALTHELIHALDCPGENPGHGGWDVWQWGAVEAASVP